MKTPILALAALLLAGANLHAQASTETALPACTEGGVGMQFESEFRQWERSVRTSITQ
jgi:hypothetical protein